MRRFAVLLKKELREILTLQMFLPFVIVMVLFVSIGQIVSDVGSEQADTFPIAVSGLGSDPYSEVVSQSLTQAGFDPIVIVPDEPTEASVETILDLAGANVLLAVPPGFSASFAAGEVPEFRTWTRVRHFSFIGNADVTALSSALAIINSSLAVRIGAEAATGVPPQLLQQPIAVSERVIVAGKSAETPAAAVMSFVSQQTTFIPIVLFVAVIFASQMIATTIATEKENKTLETLLSYPVSRSAIVTSKMVAAGLVALVVGGAYLFGINRFTAGITKGLVGDAAVQGATASEAAMQQLGLTLSTGDYALLGLTLFGGILVALAISIILGAFAENVKSVQALLTPVMVLLFVPYFLTMFLDLSALPGAARLAVLAIPFTYLFTAGPNIFLGNYGTVWFGIAYEFVWFAAFVTIAARVFSSDRILTMKLSMGRRKR